MAILSDRWIRRMAQEKGMIEPFVDAQKRDGVISYGLSSYGYDARVGTDFKIFTNVNSAVVDPKNFDQQQLRRPQHRRLRHPAQLLRAGAHGRIFPHPARRAGDLRRQVDLRALRHHRERDAAGTGVGRPRYAGVLQHHAAAREIYANEGACQFLFLQGNEPCEISYRDKAGKYQGQRGVTLPKI